MHLLLPYKTKGTFRTTYYYIQWINRVIITLSNECKVTFLLAKYFTRSVTLTTRAYPFVKFPSYKQTEGRGVDRELTVPMTYIVKIVAWFWQRNFEEVCLLRFAAAALLKVQARSVAGCAGWILGPTTRAISRQEPRHRDTPNFRVHLKSSRDMVKHDFNTKDLFANLRKICPMEMQNNWLLRILDLNCRNDGIL